MDQFLLFVTSSVAQTQEISPIILNKLTLSLAIYFMVLFFHHAQQADQPKHVGSK